MASDRAHVLSKPQAVACLATLVFLILGGIWGVEGADGPVLAIVVLYILVTLAGVIAAAVTPNAGEYAKGLLRAERMGRSRVAFWDDHAPNRVILAALCGMVLAGATITWGRLDQGNAGFAGATRPDLSLTIAIGVLVVAYIGLAFQYFQLAYPRRAALYFGLFLFLVWAVPLLAGTIMLLATSTPGQTSVLGQVLFSLSPVAGIGVSSGMAQGTAVMPTRAAALCPALVFALAFNNLVSSARRRIEHEVHSRPEKTTGGSQALEPAESLATAPSGG